MRLSSLAIFMISTCGFAQPFYAQDISFGMEGTAGLIDMPDASVLPDGETAFTYSAMGETTRYNFAFQLLPRLESAVHYSSIGAWDADGLFDASVDLKYQLLDEKGLRPAVAIGSRDFLSNGVYSSEYLVASKTVADDFTVTGGVGWGRLGTANSVGQLLGERPPQDSTGLDFDHFFKGDMGVFGGVAWRTPVNGLTVKAEYSSDAYTQEQAHGGFSPLSQFNFGAEYAPVNGVSLGAYYNYGTDLGFRVTFHGNPNRPIVSPDLGMGPVPIKPRSAGYSTNASWAANPIATTALAGGLAPVLAAEGIVLEEMLITGTTIDLYVTNSNMPMTTKAIGRIARSLTLALPPSVEVFRITPVSGDLATVTVEIKRSDMEAQAETADAAPRSWQTTRLLDAENHLTAANAWQRERDSNFEWGIAPNVPISLDSGALGFDVLLAGTASLRLGQGMSINGAVSQKIFGSAATDAEPSDSPTPVRSNAALYNDDGPSIDRLTADYVFKLSPTTFARVSAGYLETMFAGVSGEVLWKPVAQNWGLGFEVNAVQQRATDNLLGLDDYQAVTGYASLYVDTGFHDLEAQVDVGRYLAGDVGATFALSRHFANGWEVSGFVTLTDMSFEDYGDGNFTKGFEITIPLRWTMPLDTRSTLGLGLGNYSGDGGARLNLNNRLYPTIRDYESIDFEESWGAYWQ